MSNTSLEIIHEGWLTKSPPSKPIWRARWRRRWFVLRHSGELPGQYFLEYYTDQNCRKLKGKIDLDQCEQVDAGLRFENRKQKYQHMFDVKTPKRVYYLVAESEEDMNKWVEYVCHVCGLKAYKDEDEYDYVPPTEDEEAPAVSESLTNEKQDPVLGPARDSPPISPTSTISGPYIPISECISGKSLSSPNGLEDFNNILRQAGYGIAGTTQYGLTVNRDRQTTWQKHNQCSEDKTQGSASFIGTGETGAMLQVKTPVLPAKRPPKPFDGTVALENLEFYDSPRKLHPPNLELRQVSGTPPLHSPATDGESVFTDEEWTVPLHYPPSVNWETFPDGENIRQTRPSDSSAEMDMGSRGDIGSWSVVKRFGKLTIVDSVNVPRDGPIGVHGRQLSLPTNLQHQSVAPPRPPKPFHLLLEAPSHNYLNLENVSPQARHNRNIRKASVASLSSDTPKRTGAPVSPNDCVSASDGNEEPPSPLCPPQCTEIVGVSDEMYDFPRSHQYANNPSSTSSADCTDGKIHVGVRHCYTNAAPSNVNGEVFRYDFHNSDSPLSAPQEGATTLEEPISPHSDGSSSLASSSTAAVYSNLPSPLITQGIQSGTDVGHGGIPTPPAVNRGLKPGRKLSDSASLVSNEPSPVSPAAHLVSGHLPPSVDRKLKPQLKVPEQVEPLPLAAPPACRSGSENSRSVKKPRAAPSPTPPSSAMTTLRNGQRQRSEHNSSSDDDHRNSPDEPIYYYQHDDKFIPVTRFQELQYLDLDLEWDAASATSSTTQIPKSPERVQATSTVYKTVDFVKTEAFNRTRQEVEEVRKQCSAADL